MSTAWDAPQRYQVLQVLDSKRKRFRVLVWDSQLGLSVPSPRGKRRAMTLTEAFTLADALNQHPATRAQSGNI